MENDNCTMTYKGITYKCAIALALSIPKVEYFLTDKGYSVLPILEKISKWGADYCNTIA